MRFRKFLKPYRTRGSSFREHTVFHKREKKLFRLCDTHYLLWTFMDTAKISNKSSIDFG